MINFQTKNINEYAKRGIGERLSYLMTKSKYYKISINYY